MNLPKVDRWRRCFAFSLLREQTSAYVMSRCGVGQWACAGAPAYCPAPRALMTAQAWWVRSVQ